MAQNPILNLALQGRQGKRVAENALRRGVVHAVRPGAQGAFLCDVEITHRAGLTSIVEDCQSNIPLRVGQHVFIDLVAANAIRGATVKGLVQPPKAQNIRLSSNQYTELPIGPSYNEGRIVRISVSGFDILTNGVQYRVGDRVHVIDGIPGVGREVQANVSAVDSEGGITDISITDGGEGYRTCLLYTSPSPRDS